MNTKDELLEAMTSAVTSVAPTASARVRLRPIDARGVVITDGLLAERRQVNHDVTLLHGLAQMEEVGTLENLRIAAGLAQGERRGMVFSDSDVYKWLEAVAWELEREPSPELRSLAEETAQLIAAAQQDDGYINSYGQVVNPGWRWTDLEMGHELYCAGHLFQAAVASARATGDTALLDVALRFADLIDREFQDGAQTTTDGHPIVELALVELFRQTGERRYLRLAETLVSRRGHGTFVKGTFDLDYYQDAAPVREQDSLVGHAVRALYLAAGVTDLYAETSDAALLEAMQAQWRDAVETKTYLTGGLGSRHYGEAIGDPYELPPDRAYCETCAAIASIMWNWRMLLVSGESRFADQMERALYNAFLAGYSLDGTSFFYTNPLQSRSGLARHHWDPVACCPPNIMRLLASLHHYIATVSDSGLQLQLYTPSRIRAEIPGVGPVELAVETGYPWSGSIAVTVVSSPDQPWTLSLRIPSWARTAAIDRQDVATGEYAHLTRRWQAGERVLVELDMSPRLTAANPQVDAIRGCVAVERGPVVYCLEATDLPAGVELADVALAPGAAPTDSGHIPELGSVPAVEIAGVVTTFNGAAQPLYAEADAPTRGRTTSPAQLRAVPYFTWANRGTGAMRVWIPLQPSA